MSIILDLLNSKKFVAALIGVITGISVKLGVPETQVSEILTLLSPILAYIGAQGFADIGKEKALTQAGADLAILQQERAEYEQEAAR